MRAARAFLCLVFVLPAGRGPAAEKATPPGVHLLVPAYFYPAGASLKDWDRLFQSPARAYTVVIVNPASGPGKAADPNYTDVCKKGVRAGVTLIGYVTMGYGKRPIRDVEADVDRWVTLYPEIRGIFFDEQPSDAGHVDELATLYRYVRTHKGLALVISNPGAVCSEGYLSRPATDAACLFEGPLASGSFAFPAWTAKYGRDRVAALPYRVATPDQMRACLGAAVKKGVGYVYVTDAADNPWVRLPHYWDAEAAAVVGLNRR